jgi:hypothetical protein
MSFYGWATKDSDDTIKYHFTLPEILDDTSENVTYTSSSMHILDDLLEEDAKELNEHLGDGPSCFDLVLRKTVNLAGVFGE